MDGHSFEIFRICEKLRYEGVSVLNISLSFPEYGLFREIAENACEWAKNTLYGALCREYEADTDPRKKFKFGYEYKFICGICFCGDGLISVKTDVMLKDRRTGNIRDRNGFGAVIRETDGALLPIEAIADKKAVKSYRKKCGASFFIDKRGVILLQSDGEESILCEKIEDFWRF